MKRRDLIKGAGAGLLAAAFTPARAAELPAAAIPTPTALALTRSPRISPSNESPR